MSNKIYDSEKNKGYKRFVILTEEEEESKKDKTSLLLYIGNDAAVLQLIRTHFDQVAHARSHREGLLFLHNRSNELPKAILFESAKDLTDLSSAMAHSSQKESLASIPSILLSCCKDEINAPAASGPAKPDEIIYTDQLNGEQIAAKIIFWIKLKAAIHSFNEEKKIILPDFYSQGPEWTASRLLDIFVSFIGLLFLTPILALIALLIKLDSRGPVFYIAPRAGRGYRIFSFYKFRTMYTDASARQSELLSENEYKPEDPRGPFFFKMQDDPRATRIGKWLRKTSLDELPQLLNVLKGDISLIGNRPLPLEEASTLTTNSWSKRFLAPAGIVSLWHIQKSDRKQPSIKERLQYDLMYVRKQHLLLDLWLLIKTPWWMLGMKNK
jgi:lipopolysaccharide/colanic/teichoic acid biosynthesis glycosyltransferase